jgi:glutamate-1-semialdehyde 2,1-aminomutase
MNEFLRKIDTPEIKESYKNNDSLWNNRVLVLNSLLAEKDLPVKVANMSSVWTITYTRPGRYNWMFQYYLRSEGLAISWVGSGRLIMSHNFSDEEFESVIKSFVVAAERMRDDGWWYNENLSNKAIKRQILKEIISSIFR